MDDKDVLERLLEVLNRIDGRLKSIESSVATTKAAAPEQVEEGTALPRGENNPRVLVESADIVEGERDLERVAPAVKEDPVAHNASSQKGKGIERPTQPEPVLKPICTEPSKNVQTLDISPTALSDPRVELHGESSSSIQTQIISPTASTTDTSPQSEQHGEGSSIASGIGITEQTGGIHPQDQTGRGNDGLNDYYFKMPAVDWVNLAKDESGQPRNSTPEMEALWTELFGIFWTIPPDNRVDLAFQKHVLLSLPHEKEEAITRSIGQWFSDRNSWDNLSFSVTDFGNEDTRIIYQRPDTHRQQAAIDYYTRLGIVIATPTLDINESDTEGVKWVLRDESGAPWNRVIHLQGLGLPATSQETEVDLGNGIMHLHGKDPLFPVLKPEWEGTGPLNIRVLESTDKHLMGSFSTPDYRALTVDIEVSQHDSTLLCPTINFQVVFYAICKEPPKSGSREPRITGRLYNDGPYIQSQVVSLCFVSRGIYHFRRKRKPPRFWTLVALTSSGNIELPFIYGLHNYDMLQGVLVFVGKVLVYLMDRWGELVDYFDSFLDDGKTFLIAKEHDNLLVDDENFSRSRKYFWSLSCLSEFMLYINDAIHQWEASRDIWAVEFDDFLTGESKDYIEDNNKLCEKLKALRDRMQHHHTNVTALRDGLFNASAVMESRASTRLGENVKLLTFVSIFFLPLAFCTSLWSMSDTLFPLHILIYVIIFVALATYLIVFNLNTLVRLFSRAYESYKISLITKMKSEKEAEYWKRRGERFENFQFRPKAEVAKPSEWLLVGYALRRAGRWVGEGLMRGLRLGRKVRGEGEEEVTVRPAEEDGGREMPGTAKKGLFKRMGMAGRRSGNGAADETTMP